MSIEIPLRFLIVIASAIFVPNHDVTPQLSQMAHKPHRPGPRGLGTSGVLREGWWSPKECSPSDNSLAQNPEPGLPWMQYCNQWCNHYHGWVSGYCKKGYSGNYCDCTNLPIVNRAAPHIQDLPIPRVALDYDPELPMHIADMPKIPQKPKTGKLRAASWWSSKECNGNTGETVDHPDGFSTCYLWCTNAFAFEWGYCRGSYCNCSTG